MHRVRRAVPRLRERVPLDRALHRSSEFRRTQRLEDDVVDAAAHPAHGARGGEVRGDGQHRGARPQGGEIREERLQAAVVVREVGDDHLRAASSGRLPDRSQLWHGDGGHAEFLEVAQHSRRRVRIGFVDDHARWRCRALVSVGLGAVVQGHLVQVLSALGARRGTSQEAKSMMAWL